MTEEEQITIYLSPKEAELFKTFRQYQDLWEQIFKIREGSVELHFDSTGKMKPRFNVGYDDFKKLSTIYPLDR